MAVANRKAHFSALYRVRPNVKGGLDSWTLFTLIHLGKTEYQAREDKPRATHY